MPVSGIQGGNFSSGEGVALQAKPNFDDNINTLLNLQGKQIGVRAKQWDELQKKRALQDEQFKDYYKDLNYNGIWQGYVPDLKRDGAQLIDAMQKAKSENPNGNWINNPELQKRITEHKFDVDLARTNTKRKFSELEAGQNELVAGKVVPTEHYNNFLNNPEKYHEDIYKLTGQKYGYIPGAFYNQVEKPIDQFKLESEALKDLPKGSELGNPQKIGYGKFKIPEYTTRQKEDLAASADILYNNTPQLQNKYPTVVDYQQDVINRHSRVKSNERIESIPESEKQDWNYGRGTANNKEYQAAIAPVSTRETPYGKGDSFVDVTIKPIKKDTQLPEGSYVTDNNDEVTGKFDKILYDKNTGEKIIRIRVKNEKTDEGGKVIKLPDIYKTVPYDGNEGTLKAQIGDFDVDEFIKSNLGGKGQKQTQFSGSGKAPHGDRVQTKDGWAVWNGQKYILEK